MGKRLGCGTHLQLPPCLPVNRSPLFVVIVDCCGYARLRWLLPHPIIYIYPRNVSFELSLHSKFTSATTTMSDSEQVAFFTYILERLKQCGVKQIFGVPGDFNLTA